LGFKFCWAKPLVHNSPAYGDLMRMAGFSMLFSRFVAIPWRMALAALAL